MILYNTKILCYGLTESLSGEKIYYSFDELKAAIGGYIKYYNEERIKERLGWMRPVQYRLAKAA